MWTLQVQSGHRILFPLCNSLLISCCWRKISFFFCNINEYLELVKLCTVAHKFSRKENDNPPPPFILPTDFCPRLSVFHLQHKKDIDTTDQHQNNNTHLNGAVHICFGWKHNKKILRNKIIMFLGKQNILDFLDFTTPDSHIRSI